MPLSESSILQKDGLYVISLFRTTSVLTRVGTRIYLKEYKPGNKAQIFRCTLSSLKHFGLISEAATGEGDRVGRDSWEVLGCNTSNTSEDEWEDFYFRPSPSGGYQILMPKGKQLCPLEVVSDRNGKQLAMRKESDRVFGLTRVGTAGSGVQMKLHNILDM